MIIGHSDRDLGLRIYEFPSPQDHPLSLSRYPCLLELPPLSYRTVVLKKKLHLAIESQIEAERGHVYRTKPQQVPAPVTAATRSRRTRVARPSATAPLEGAH